MASVSRIPLGRGLILCMLLTPLLAASCMKRDRIYELEKAEAAEAAMSEAMEMQRLGEADKAYDLYRNIVIMHPTNALAHLQIGIVLQDSLREPAAAIYHFETYLRLRPEAEKAAVVEDRIRQAKDELGRRFGGSAAAVDVTALQSESDRKILALTKEVQDRDSRLKKAQDDVVASQTEVGRLSREVSRLQKLLDTMLNKDTVSVPTPQDLAHVDMSTGTPSHVTAPTTSIGTYAVKRGDTLWTIAQRVYGDASRNTDIREANKGKIGPNDKLTEGMILVLP